MVAVPNPTRIVHCADAIEWLKGSPPVSTSIVPSFVSSMPDISEFPGYTFEQWRAWFETTAELILARTPSDGVTIFFQSDIRINGTWIDKAYLCQLAAERAGVALLWHRIASRVPIGHSTFGRAGYSHILCFSRSVRPQANAAAADVIAHVGDKSWERGIGVTAVLAVVKFIADHTASTTIINPFCGHGSVLAAANAVGLNAVGIERSLKRAQIARALQLDLNARRWVVPQCSAA